MPEGHSIHRLARDQQELVGRVVQATSPQGRFRSGAAAVDGQRVEQVEAVGKHLLHHYGNGQAVHVHLGMQGKFLRFQPVTGEALKQVRLHLTTGDLAWDLIAPSTCELLDHDAVVALKAALGPDPLDPAADLATAAHNLRTSGTTIGEALLDQRLIAGVGNVFRAESLLRTHVHPRTPAGDLTEAQYDDLLATLQTMMKQAVDDDEIKPKLIYKQPTCLQCDTGATTETFDLHGRTAYACPHCQPQAQAGLHR